MDRNVQRVRSRRMPASGAPALARVIATAGLGVWLAGASGLAGAGVMFGESPAGTIGGGFRWDAAPRTIAGFGERSLDGGLRYSLQGGSYQAYRDFFSWSGGTPTVAAFQTAVEQAFNAWTVPDPVSGLTTRIVFVFDP